MSAFLFEFVMQMANQLTGFFFSFVPHMLHNAIVVFNSQTVFAVGGSLGVFLWPARSGWLASIRACLLDVWRVVVRDARRLGVSR